MHHSFRYVVKPDKGELSLERLVCRSPSLTGLDAAADYTAHFADPDIHLDWGDILQVILPTSSSALSSVSTGTVDQPFDSDSRGAIPTCPICLSEPTAARMVSSYFCWA